MFYAASMAVNGIDRVAQSRASQAQSAANEARGDIKDLERQVERMALLNQALWELVRERLHLTDADLERMAQEVDLRDGMPDGRMTRRAVRCPTCQRVNSSRHKKCIYCSTEFETMAYE